MSYSEDNEDISTDKRSERFSDDEILPLHQSKVIDTEEFFASDDSDYEETDDEF